MTCVPVTAQVEVIRFNLLLADWGDEDHLESLLAEKNAKWGREYLTNVKCVCSSRRAPHPDMLGGCRTLLANEHAAHG